ncbi:hypothetical protein [Sphingomonas abaci]|uniref:Uncharacterized protein n=1 Tax=Sphingomonas abaci TaxID=237611 RepID=A0A7W7AG07_9SPHN|nr:hypothetical protein [Sphingomonas abaci]MBB4616296.1 hypothetical protein [Sphingomonas abaci]
MNKLMTVCVGAALVAAAGAGSAKPWVASQAQLSLGDGAAKAFVWLVKNGDAYRTVTCRDTADVLASFQPEAVAFDVTRNKKGKPVEQEDVAGVETFTPVAFQNCQVMGGNQFVSQVDKTLGWAPPVR